MIKALSLSIIVTIALMYSLTALPLLAQTTNSVTDVCSDPAFASENPVFCNDFDGSNTFFGDGSVFQAVLQILIIIVSIASVIVIIVNGLRYVVSSGDPNTSKSARMGIIYALVGLVVAAFAQAIVTFVLSNL